MLDWHDMDFASCIRVVEMLLLAATEDAHSDSICSTAFTISSGVGADLRGINVGL